jgi:hypothetical protein
LLFNPSISFGFASSLQGPSFHLQALASIVQLFVIQLFVNQLFVIQLSCALAQL